MFQLNSLSRLIGAVRPVYKLDICQIQNVDILNLRIQISKGPSLQGMNLVIHCTKSSLFTEEVFYDEKIYSRIDRNSCSRIVSN